MLLDWTVAPPATLADDSASLPSIVAVPVGPPPDNVNVTVETVAATPSDSRTWNVTGWLSILFAADSVRAFTEMTLRACNKPDRHEPLHSAPPESNSVT
jgi:hypothetical protein